MNSSSITVIFGANGYIGSELHSKLTKQGVQCLNYSHTSLLNKDQNEIQEISESIKSADTIYYLSSQTSAYNAEKFPLRDFNSNLIPLLTLLELITHNGKKPNFIYTSTVTVYGLTPLVSIDEKYPTQPETFYELLKLQAEEIIKFYHQRKNINASILRLANIYGPSSVKSNPDRGILNAMIKKAYLMEPITIYGTGSYVRDYIYIADLIDILLFFKNSNQHENEVIYNVGTGISHRIIDVVKILKTIMKEKYNIDLNINFVNEPANMLNIERRNFICNNFKIKSKTKLEFTDISSGILQTLNFINQNN